MTTPMNDRTKAIMVNCSIVIALLYLHWQGTPLFFLAISGILVFVPLNLWLIFAAKKRPTSTN